LPISAQGPSAGILEDRRSAISLGGSGMRDVATKLLYFIRSRGLEDGGGRIKVICYWLFVWDRIAEQTIEVYRKARRA